MALTQESEKKFVREYAKLGSLERAGIEADYSQMGAWNLAVRVGIETEPRGRPKAGSLSDRMALAALIIEGSLVAHAARRLGERIGVATVFRMLRSVKEENPRFFGVAAIISHPEDDRQILICREREARQRYFKRVGDVTIPMGFAAKKATTEANLARLVWREVFRDAPIVQGSWWESSMELVSKDPLATFQIVDCSVPVYHARLRADPHKLGGFTSDKTSDHNWMDVVEVLQLGEKGNKGFHLRWGVSEMLTSYLVYLENPQAVFEQNNKPIPSQLNLLLVQALKERRIVAAQTLL